MGAAKEGKAEIVGERERGKSDALSLLIKTSSTK